MYRRYYSYNDMPQLIRHDEPKEDTVHKNCTQESECNMPVCSAPKGEKLFGRFELDDVILGVIILAILLDDSNDNLLIIALAVIFLTGII